MEELLKKAKKLSDKAEVYFREYTYYPISFKNAKLHDIDSTFQSGYSLRIIKDGKLGFAYTRNLTNRDELIHNALDSLKGGVGASYAFPLTKKVAPLNTYDDSLNDVTGAQMVNECTRVCDFLKSKTDGVIACTSSSYIENIRIINSEGTDVSGKNTIHSTYAYIAYPGTGARIYRVHNSKKFEKIPDDVLNRIVEIYTRSSKVVALKSGKMKVCFMPNSMLAFNWRIFSGASGKSIYERISPLADKIGEKIFDEKITIYDDPLNDTYPGARAFDDEGVACEPLTIVENGVLKNFFYDLHYAQKLNTKSTGHGYRTTRWGGDPATLKPAPTLSHMRIKPGHKPLAEIIKSMDSGIVIEGILGAHSGNIPNGDYSVGISSGLYVENGEIVGRIKDAMVAGNIYETFKHVIDISDTLYPCFWGWLPAILFDNVNVATKG